MQTTPETILLVDDEPHVRSMLRDALEISGYAVVEAGDGIKAAKAEAEVAGPIHLLLTDVMMPGLSGPDLARRLRPRRPRMKVIYMTAFTLVDFRRQAIELEPGVPILAKPFGIDVLVRKVREVLAPEAFSWSRRHAPARTGSPIVCIHTSDWTIPPTCLTLRV
jgi:two-component system, cell cycle sensor histidine kinase and response regulator CckA